MSRFSCGFILLFFLAGGQARAQADSTKTPEIILIDLVLVTEWGPFTPRSDYPAKHWKGVFSVKDSTYTVFALIKDGNKNIQVDGLRAVFETVQHRVRPEAEGNRVYYFQEKIVLEGVQYDIVNLKESAGVIKYPQLVLTMSEGLEQISPLPKVGSQAPQIDAYTVTGKRISLSDLRGKFVLLDFWGTWCAPCINQIPDLKDIYTQYGDRVEILGIAYEETDDPEVLISFLEEWQITWPQVIQKQSGVFEPASTIIGSYGVGGYPTNILIGPDGIVLESDRKKLEGSKLKEALIKFLK